ncbi:hypothetical protein pb186bvf_009144 [Paramecium bursaria]
MQQNIQQNNLFNQENFQQYYEKQMIWKQPINQQVKYFTAVGRVKHIKLYDQEHEFYYEKYSLAYLFQYNGDAQYKNIEQYLRIYDKIKYFAILKPIRYILNDNMIYVIVSDYQPTMFLSQEKIGQMQQQERNHIMLQLCMLYRELQYRYSPIKKLNLDQILYIDGTIYISVVYMDILNDIKSTAKDQIFNFIKILNIPYNGPEDIDICLKQLIEMNDLGKQLQRTQFEKLPCNFQILLNIFGVHQTSVKNIAQLANSFIYQLPRNNKFDIIFRDQPDLEGLQEIVVKSQKIDQCPEEKKSQKIKDQNKELDIMEKLQNQRYFAVCLAYMRVFDSLFLIMEKQLSDLSVFLNTSGNYRKLDLISIFLIAEKLTESLSIMHKKNIVHRDLKPQNIFITNQDIKFSKILIADFDVSKDNSSKIKIMQTENFETTCVYSPPETEFCPKSDIWQVGYIMLEIFLQKQSILGRFGASGCSEQELEQVLSLEAIENQFQISNQELDPKQKQQAHDFAVVLSEMLKHNKSLRPTADVAFQRLRQIGRQSRIKSIVKIQS